MSRCAGGKQITGLSCSYPGFGARPGPESNLGEGDEEEFV